jgi:solute carrier family 10 (sodium/bile acid cotransporter), member 7
MCRENKQTMSNSIENTTHKDREEGGESVQDPQEAASTDHPLQGEGDKKAPARTCLQKCIKYYWEYEFLILVMFSILLARAYPPLGATYLAPDITADWIAVLFIFLMAGLGLKTAEFRKAVSHVYFNVLVQVFSFGVVSSVVFGVARGLTSAGILSHDLADGMVICSTLPMAINMVDVMTTASGGDEAAAIFNAALGNLLGVFLSPVLILGYLGVKGGVNLLDVFYKLVARVVAPVVFGQLLQKFSKPTVKFVALHKRHFARIQQFCLVFIVYTVFCDTFKKGSGARIGDIFLMIACQFVLLSGFIVLSWMVLKVLFPRQPALRVMGLFGCTYKTVAIGVPLINAIYENNPSAGLYTLPVLIWHPMQLVIGTVLAPHLRRWVTRENERLGITTDPVDDGNNNGATDAQSVADQEAEAAENGRVAATDTCDEIAATK